MKKEDLANALNEIDDDLLLSVQRARMAPAKIPFYRRKSFIAVTAAACVFAVMIATVPRPQRSHDETPAVTDTQGHGLLGSSSSVKNPEVITLSHEQYNSSSSGFGIVLYPDLKAETDYNPWNEEMELQSLPVFKRIPSSAGIPYGLSEKEIQANLDHYAEYFDVHVKEVNKDLDPEGNVYGLTAWCEEGTLSSDSYATVLFLNQDHAVSLEEGISLNVESDQETAERAMEYLHDRYGDLLDSNEWAYDIGGDFTYDARRIRNFVMYAKGASDEDTIVNYNLKKIVFAGSEDGSQLDLIRVFNEPAAYDTVSEYPLINADEAYQELLKGNCFANTGGIMPDENTEIADVQLVYMNNRAFEYVLPCYLFHADITDAAKKVFSDLPGLRQYGLYYVPALSPEYITWTDEPLSYDEPLITETAAAGGAEASSETSAPDMQTHSSDEPVIGMPGTVSNRISINRILQQEDYYCSAACAQMILNHFGIDRAQSDLADEMNTYRPGERSDGISGTYDTDVARVLSEYLFGAAPQNDMDGGYRVQPVSEVFKENEYNQFVKRVRRNIDDGYPSIIQIRVSSLYGGSTSSNHNVLVTGYEEGKDFISLTLLDPYYDGNQGNGVSVYDASAVFQSIVESVEPSYIW